MAIELTAIKRTHRPSWRMRDTLIGFLVGVIVGYQFFGGNSTRGMYQATDTVKKNSTTTPIHNETNSPTEEGPPAEEHNTKNNLDHNDDMCVFILATPGSGSSTMVDLVGSCRPNPPPDPPLFHQQKTPLPVSSYKSSCFISGENWGTFQELHHVYSTVNHTEQLYTASRTEHDKAAWKMYFQLPHALNKIQEVALTILNPYNSSCWGFKEIRHGRNHHDNFDSEIHFLANLCPNPKIILHTRRNHHKEMQSSILQHLGDTQQLQSLQQRLCFDTYMGMPLNQTIVNSLATAKQPLTYPQCQPQPPKQRQQPPKQQQLQQPKRQQQKQQLSASTPPFVFRHHLEDYMEGNEHFQTLWKDFLKCQGDPPSVCNGNHNCHQGQSDEKKKNSHQ